MEVSKQTLYNVQAKMFNEYIRFSTDNKIETLDDVFDYLKRDIAACQKIKNKIQFYKYDSCTDMLSSFITVDHFIDLDEIMVPAIEKQGFLIEGQVARVIFEYYRTSIE